MPQDINKKTTVKLLKKGKINFDGGNCEHEILELYYWLQYIYSKYSNDILVDISKISNTYNSEALEMYKNNPKAFIYDDDLTDDSSDDLTDEKTK